MDLYHFKLSVLKNAFTTCPEGWCLAVCTLSGPSDLQHLSFAPWEAADARAASHITLNCNDSLQAIISAYETYKEIWDSLKNKYRPPTIASRMSTFQYWDSLYFGGKDLEGYCIQYQQILGESDALGIEFDNELGVCNYQQGQQIL